MQAFSKHAVETICSMQHTAVCSAAALAVLLDKLCKGLRAWCSTIRLHSAEVLVCRDDNTLTHICKSAAPLPVARHKALYYTSDSKEGIHGAGSLPCA